MRLIDADALKKSFCENCMCNTKDKMCGANCVVQQIIEIEPEIEAEPVVHGWWIPHAAYEEFDIAYCDYVCSECGREITKRVLCVPPRCENCGAKMDGGAKNGFD